MTNSRERDQSIERLLRQSRQVLQAPDDGAVSDSCLDSETLAAWADGGLSGPAREAAQSHVADCARCQALVGTLARINTVIPPAQSEQAARGWLRWIAPLAATAAALAAVALWVAVPRDAGAPRQAKEEARAPVAGPSVSGTMVGRVAEQTAEGRGANESRSQAEPSAAVGGVAGINGVTGAARADVAADNQLGAQAPELRKDADRLEAAIAQQPLRSNAPAAAPPPVAPPAALLRDNAAASARPTFRAADAAGVEIVSPDPAVRWRIAGSTIERSTNGGSTWQEVATGFTGQLTAGAAPSPSVCWLVGRGGFMLLATVTTSGVSWRRVAFPEPTDLSAVRATDARTVSVTSVDGRTFSTTDGGATWVLTPQDF